MIIHFNLLSETISRTEEGQPRPNYIFNKCGTNIYFFTLQRFGPSPSPNFKYCYTDHIKQQNLNNVHSVHHLLKVVFVRVF